MNEEVKLLFHATMSVNSIELRVKNMSEIISKKKNE